MIFDFFYDDFVFSSSEGRARVEIDSKPAKDVCSTFTSTDKEERDLMTRSGLLYYYT